MSTSKTAVKATAKKETTAEPVDVFAPLPDAVKTAMATVPTPQNAREQAGTHLNPRMGRMLRAFRAANGNISQVKVAKGDIPGFDNQRGALSTTHCQIATLEQGGCKKGADAATVKLLSEALGVSEDVIRAINEADLRERHERGDKLAAKVLGIEDGKPAEEETTPSEGEPASTEPAPEPVSLS